MIRLGIDPDRGWAIVETGRNRRKVIEAGSVKGMPEMAEKIRDLAARYSISQVRIERPVNKNVYNRPGQNVRQMKKVSVNIGENRAKAEAIYWFCKGLGLKTVYANPVRNGTKLSAKQIERLTGWAGRTNEHARDAIVLAWV